MPTDTPRSRARAETIEQIKDIAREHLARDGADLSLRAVARDLGVVSSAVYRYFASRDELLTALILEAYDAMGEVAEAADAAVSRQDLNGRWTATWESVRRWSREHPHEYALLYGTPIPGYVAPQDTVVAAQRVVVVMAAVLRDGVESRAIAVPRERLPRAVRADVTTIARFPGLEGVPPTLLVRAMSVWAQLFGTISFELFGRYTNGISDLDAYFGHQVQATAAYVGIR